jgi:hypothetical protein
MMRVSSRLLFLAALTLGTLASHSKVPKGFVYPDGAQFALDGKSFVSAGLCLRLRRRGIDGRTQNFVGANSYWLPLLTTQHDVESTFASMKSAGVKVSVAERWHGLWRPTPRTGPSYLGLQRDQRNRAWRSS